MLAETPTHFSLFTPQHPALELGAALAADFDGLEQGVFEGYLEALVGGLDLLDLVDADDCLPVGTENNRRIQPRIEFFQRNEGRCLPLCFESTVPVPGF